MSKRRSAPVKFTEDEDAQIWKFAIENLDQFERGSNKFWLKLVETAKLDRYPRTITKRFSICLAPKLHKTEFDMETKLKLYKHCEIPVDPEFLKTLKAHYHLEFDNHQLIVGYARIQIQNDGKEKRKMSSEADHDGQIVNVKRARSALGIEEELDGEGVAENENTREKEESEELEILEFENASQDSPEVVVDLDDDPPPRKGPKEVIEKALEASASIAYNQFEPKTEDFDEFYEDDVDVPQISNPWDNRSVDFDDSSDYRSQPLTPLETTSDMAKMMQNMTQKMDNFDGKLTKITEDIGAVSSKVATLTDTVEVIRHQISPEAGEPNVPNKKEYLQKLKNFVISLNAPELEDVQQRIDVAIQNSSDDDVNDPVQMRLIRSSLDTTLLLIGQ